MPGNNKLSSNIKAMGFMKRSAEKVDEETIDSKKRKRELHFFAKQWDRNNNGISGNNKKGGGESNNGLIIVKDNKSQHSHGRRSFSGFNKTVESHLARGTDDTSSPKKKKKKKNQNSGKNGRTGKQSFKILDLEM